MLTFWYDFNFTLESKLITHQQASRYGAQGVAAQEQFLQIELILLFQNAIWVSFFRQPIQEHDLNTNKGIYLVIGYLTDL